MREKFPWKTNDAGVLELSILAVLMPELWVQTAVYCLQFGAVTLFPTS